MTIMEVYDEMNYSFHGQSSKILSETMQVMLQGTTNLVTPFRRTTASRQHHSGD